jgi:RimJ/RimL family protein N-acetyltransferase
MPTLPDPTNTTPTRIILPDPNIVTPFTGEPEFVWDCDMWEGDEEEAFSQTAWWADFFPLNQEQCLLTAAYKVNGEFVAVLFDNQDRLEHSFYYNLPPYHRAYSFSVCVDPEWQGKGLATALVKAAVDSYCGSYCGSVTHPARKVDAPPDPLILVEVVEKDSPAMLHILRKQGFVRVGVDRTFDYSPIILMQYAPIAALNPFLLSAHDLTPGEATRLLPDSLPITFEP